MTTRKAPRVLSIGECMAELAPLENPVDFRLGFAGDTFNTAWYLRQLRADIDVSYFSAVGSDSISDRMLGFMKKAGIGTDHVARVAGHSVGMYMISLVDGERSFSYWRDTSAARCLAADEDALSVAAEASDLVYFSGITLAILSADDRARLLRVLGKARDAGKTVAFDPNLRPRLWPDEDTMTSAIMEGAKVSNLVLPSFEDEADHFGDVSPAATADRYAGVGASSIVVKNGADAVHVLHDGQATEVAITPVAQVVDTTSAGDSFNAGFLATWGSESAMADRVEYAAAVAGQVVGGKGALVTLDRRSLAAKPCAAFVDAG